MVPTRGPILVVGQAHRERSGLRFRALRPWCPLAGSRGSNRRDMPASSEIR
jgi:hypothetical protein